MDIQQFCEMLKEARKLSGVSWVDVCYRMQRTQATVISMLCGSKDPSMDKIFKFIEAIQAELIVGQRAYLHEDKFNEWMLEIFQRLSYKELSKMLNVSEYTVARCRLGKHGYKMSYFLAFVDHFKLSCEVIPIELEHIHQTDGCDIDV